MMDKMGYASGCKKEAFSSALTLDLRKRISPRQKNFCRRRHASPAGIAILALPPAPQAKLNTP
ncbi:hypothetical protein EJD96_02895 [Herbaspirillum seropedicae]|uniref:hypothetical protein n=1 Tax=Herbaspirillum seropedicae TaxID=964 RepID=UPI0011238FE7|nr:hypothetical protein [Herbaspirillum seropedicae]QDD63165.1 hypothetical protein EJD96_02895 [Herbaspirillum seropedicae]